MFMMKKGGVNTACAAIACLCVTACGGGGGENDVNSYKPASAGPGSTVVSAEAAATQASIRYAQYRSSKATNWTLPVVNATVNFNQASKSGSIQFPLANGTESISTSDGYATLAWSGPMTGGAYRFNGNLLMGCSAGASPLEASQVFASSSLERLLDAQPLDALNGLTFDLFDCALLQQSKVETLKINGDGSLTMSMLKSAATQDQMINMLNPEKWAGGALIDGVYFGGHAFRYGSNGSNKYAIVLQTRTMTNAGSVYHYMLAVQR